MATRDPVSILGPRVRLRPARSDDADALAAGFNEDPTMGAILGMEPEEENAEWLRSTFPSPDHDGREPSSFWFAMEDPGSGGVIGEIGLVDVSQPHRRAALSVMVLPRFRRAGVAREAIGLVVRWARDELDLHRVELHTYPENGAMQRVAEAAGFQREGVLHEHWFKRGQFMDDIVYALVWSSNSRHDQHGASVG